MLGFGNEEKKVKKWHWVLIALVVICSFALKFYNTYLPKRSIMIDKVSYDVMLADNPQRRYKGLSNRKDLGKYYGMYFEFERDDIHTIVMRDMNFDIDIIWIDDGKVVDIVEGAKVEKDVPESQLKRYFSEVIADSVLESRAGFVKEKEVEVGDYVILLSE